MERSNCSFFSRRLRKGDQFMSSSWEWQTKWWFLLGFFENSWEGPENWWYIIIFPVPPCAGIPHFQAHSSNWEVWSFVVSWLLRSDCFSGKNMTLFGWGLAIVAADIYPLDFYVGWFTGFIPHGYHWIFGSLVDAVPLRDFGNHVKKNTAVIRQ